MSDYSLIAQPEKSADVATLLGIIGAFLLVLGAIALGGNISAFIDVNSLLIVLGGTLGATLITFPMEDFTRSLTAARHAFFPDSRPTLDRLRKLLQYAEKARADGVISLQPLAQNETDPFLRKSLELMIDGLQPDELRRVLGFEINFLENRHKRGAEIFQTMGAVAPAMGLVGTLIGLVQMLAQLDQSSSIGPGMAVALLTTFYGALLSNIIFLPIAGKLRARSREETQLREMTLEGVLCIAQGVNPRIVEEYLHSFLAPDDRISLYR